MSKIIIFLSVVFLLLQIIQVFVVNTVAADSIENAQLQTQLDAVESKNAVIKSELLKYTSYTHVSSKAAELGFKDTKSFMMVDTPLEVAVSSNTIQ